MGKKPSTRERFVAGVDYGVGAIVAMMGIGMVGEAERFHESAVKLLARIPEALGWLGIRPLVWTIDFIGAVSKLGVENSTIALGMLMVLSGVVTMVGGHVALKQKSR